jgi:hypothetical protein
VGRCLGTTPNTQGDNSDLGVAPNTAKVRAAITTKYPKSKNAKMQKIIILKKLNEKHHYLFQK